MNLRRKFVIQFSSVRTGIILLILVAVASIAGTLVLQRPITDAEQLQRTYSPQTLRWLDALGLTDVFHTWWFAALLALLGVNIVMASVERFPQAWRYFARPYRRPEPHFLAALPLHEEIPVRDLGAGINAAERAFGRARLKAQRIGAGAGASLYAERHRVARLAPYLVHASLLLIVGGALAGTIWGYRGFVTLAANQQTNEIELRNGARHKLAFTVRCEGAGQENYPDGSPRRWWSRLVVIENGKEVKRKEIEVNEPLVHRGIRFFQSSFGTSGQAEAIRLSAAPKDQPDKMQGVVLRLGETAKLDDKTTVRLVSFVPDFVFTNNRVETRSEQPNNPAIQLAVETKGATPAAEPAPEPAKVWLFPKFPNFPHPDQSPYAFRVLELGLANYTGLQVAYEPGQAAVWAGCILLGAALFMNFYMVHVRFWAVPVSDGRGRAALWVGATANKNREELEQRFKDLMQEIVEEIGEELPALRAKESRAQEKLPVSA